MGSKLRGLGTSVFTGTRELLEQVTDAISSELDSIEGMAARNRPGAAHRSTARCATGPLSVDDLHFVALVYSHGQNKPEQEVRVCACDFHGAASACTSPVQMRPQKIKMEGMVLMIHAKGV